MRKLNFGCGPDKLKGYINIDFNKDLNPDLVLNLELIPLPFEGDSVDEVKMDSVIEHLNVDMVKFVLEVKRILKPDGILDLSLPNCFHWKSRLRFLFGDFNANSGFHYDHRWLFKPSFLVELLEFYGFEVQNNCSDLFDSHIKIIARKRR